MEGIRDQADDEIMLGNFGIESLLVGDIERDRGSTLDTSRQLLSTLQGSAS